MKKILFVAFFIYGCLTLASCSRSYCPCWGNCFNIEVVEPCCERPVSVYYPYVNYSAPYYYAVPPGYIGSSISATTPPPSVPGDTTSIYTPLPF